MFERLKWALPALSLLIAMVLLSASSRQPDRSAYTSLMMELVGPIESLLATSANLVGEFWDSYFYLVGVEQENQALREVVDRQKQQLVISGELKSANQRLTNLLGLREAYPGLTMKPAYVLAWDPGPWSRSITISVGSRDGVAVDQAVIHDTGVVGRIVETSPNYARVLLSTDFNSSIDSFIQRTRAVGLVSGQGSQPMRLQYVRKDEDVRPGDLVVTSGLDGVFPRGLALGAVSRVSRQSVDMFLAVEIIPQVVFDRLEEVMVVVNEGPAIDWLSLAPRLRPLLEDADEDRRRLEAEIKPTP